MLQAGHQTVQVYVAAGPMLVVLESFFHRVVNSRDHTDVVIAAGCAMQDLEELIGPMVGQPGIDGLKPI